MTAIKEIFALKSSARINALKEHMLSEQRFVSIEQAHIVTESYKEHEHEARCLQRAYALAAALNKISIRIDADERIVGNRSPGVRAGIVFPETGASWIDREIDTIPTRDQDRFAVRAEDIKEFREEIYPYWQGRSLEDHVKKAVGAKVSEIEKVVKINQKDHSQGHICPNTEKWLQYGPQGLKQIAAEHLAELEGSDDFEKRNFYQSVIIVMDGVSAFMNRYADLAESMPEYADHDNLKVVAANCRKLAVQPAETFPEAVQALWFLYVILQMEGNASSYSPGRMDQYLLPYYDYSLAQGMELAEALELTQCLWLKFNQIVYLRNSNSARYFAGFPIGFNVAIGGQHEDTSDAVNDLSYIFLKAQEQLLLPQPNLSARVHKNSPAEFLDAVTRVIGRGSGMPQLFNDEAIVPALIDHGVSERDAKNYAIVGCVELTTHGNALAWSDAAMFNLVKALELTINNGVDMLNGQKTGLDLGNLTDFKSYAELEAAFAKQIDYFADRMVECINVVDEMHEKLLPTPFLSSVIDDCLSNGKDVTQGGAHYNFTGVQAIQVANVADSLAGIKELIFDKKHLSAERLLDALRNDYADEESLRLMIINKLPKYGNDVLWVDEIGNKWATYFADILKKYRNRRDGIYQMGLYTVSAHVPMGQNVAASADGRKSMSPLADGGVSAMYGRDRQGPTSLLNSVARLPFCRASNGTLLNMKFLPAFFSTEDGIKKFVSLIRSFVDLGISHVQFNVLNEADLKRAQENPEEYKGLTVRVAGYTAYFVELSKDLQDEIIARTVYENL